MSGRPDTLTDAEALASLEWAWPFDACRIARRAGMLGRVPHHEEDAFRRAVVLVLAALDGRVHDENARDLLLRWDDVVPGLHRDLQEAQRMSQAFTVETFGDFLASSTRYPGAPARTLQALAVLRPDLGDMVRARAEALGRPDPLRREMPAHVADELARDETTPAAEPAIDQEDPKT